MFFRVYFLLLLNDSVNLRHSSQIVFGSALCCTCQVSDCLMAIREKSLPAKATEPSTVHSVGFAMFLENCHPLLAGGLCGVLSGFLHFSRLEQNSWHSWSIPATLSFSGQPREGELLVGPDRFQFRIFWRELKPLVTVSNDSCLVRCPQRLSRFHSSLFILTLCTWCRAVFPSVFVHIVEKNRTGLRFSFEETVDRRKKERAIMCSEQCLHYLPHSDIQLWLQGNLNWMVINKRVTDHLLRSDS